MQDLDTPFLIAAPLHLEIPLGSERVLLSVLFRVVGVSVAPFLSAIVHDLTVGQIGGNLLPVVISAPAALAIRLAAYALLRTVRRRMEGLLTIAAAAGRQVRLLRLIRDPSLRKSEIAAGLDLEADVEFVPRPRP